jgi:hypothetical protein
MEDKMKLVIKIEMDNAAFADDQLGEVTRILVKYVSKQMQEAYIATLRDVNGNKVGLAELLPS